MIFIDNMSAYCAESETLMYLLSGTLCMITAYFALFIEKYFGSSSLMNRLPYFSFLFFIAGIIFYVLHYRLVIKKDK